MITSVRTIHVVAPPTIFLHVALGLEKGIAEPFRILILRQRLSIVWTPFVGETSNLRDPFAVQECYRYMHVRVRDTSETIMMLKGGLVP